MSNALVLKNSEYGVKNYALFCKSLIDFNEAWIPYNELQFLTDPALLHTHLQSWFILRMD